MRAGRRVMWSGVAVGALLVGASGLSFACLATVGPALEEVDPKGAPVGAQIHLGGTGWKSSDPVNVYWSVDGEAVVEPALATTRSAGEVGSFSVWVTVPDSKPGVHYFAAIQGETHRLAAFQVLAPGTGTTSSDANGGQSDVSGVPGSSNGTASGGAQGLEHTTAPVAAGQAGSADDSLSSAPLAASAATPALPDGVDEAAGEEAAEATGSPVAQAAGEEAAAEQAPQPAASTVSNDLWSGSAVAPPGLPDLHAEQRANGFRPGMVLATAGVMVAFAGYGLQEVLERRRRLAHVGGDELGHDLDG